MDKKTKILNKNILRPLLDQKKENLICYQKMFLIFMSKDPSNNEMKNLKELELEKLIKKI